MKPLSIAYFGTPYFSARFLEKILTDRAINQLIEVKLVVTQPDQPVGRKQILTPSPVKEVAQKYKIKVADDYKSYDVLRPLLQNLDMAFLFAYGITLGIIPKDLLNVPKYGFLNTHPSLLPSYRGASPMVYPLILGDKKTGVTLIRLDEEIDHGPIIAQEELLISPTDRRTDLQVKLTDLAYELFKRIIRELTSPRVNELKIVAQNHAQATFTRQLTKDDGFIPFSTLQKGLNGDQTQSNRETSLIIQDYYQTNKNQRPSKIYSVSSMVYNLFRGLYAWPGIWTRVNIKGVDKRLKITDMNLMNNKLILKKVQLEGKKEVDFKTFNQAYLIF